MYRHGGPTWINPDNQNKSTPRAGGPAEFKSGAMRLVANGKPIMDAARKMGINDNLIHAWRKAHDKAGLPVRGKEN